MQVISRAINESLVIADDIFITVLDVRPDYVRLAISSPRHIPCYWEQDLYPRDCGPDVELAADYETAVDPLVEYQAVSGLLTKRRGLR